MAHNLCLFGGGSVKIIVFKGCVKLFTQQLVLYKRQSRGVKIEVVGILISRHF